jgi:hypothetical protein
MVFTIMHMVHIPSYGIYCLHVYEYTYTHMWYNTRYINHLHHKTYGMYMYMCIHHVYGIWYINHHVVYTIIWYKPWHIPPGIWCIPYKNHIMFNMKHGIKPHPCLLPHPPTPPQPAVQRSSRRSFNVWTALFKGYVKGFLCYTSAQLVTVPCEAAPAHLGILWIFVPRFEIPGDFILKINVLAYWMDSNVPLECPCFTLRLKSCACHQMQGIYPPCHILRQISNFFENMFPASLPAPAWSRRLALAWRPFLLYTTSLLIALYWVLLTSIADQQSLASPASSFHPVLCLQELAALSWRAATCRFYGLWLYIPLFLDKPDAFLPTQYCCTHTTKLTKLRSTQ